MESSYNTNMNDEAYMRMALDEARKAGEAGEVPIGAVVDAWRLSDCTVYVTLEPCIMCAGLMHQARIRRCVYGAPDPKAGALGTLYQIHADTRLNHTFEVTAGVLEDESVALLKSFFSSRRKKGKDHTVTPEND